LIRAKSGRIAGAFLGLLMVMKSLPLAYAKDMQEDKEPTFAALDALKLGLAAMAGMVADIKPNPVAMEKAAGAGHSTATDLADWLVRELGLPFRDAHHITGRIVALADRKKANLVELDLADFRSVEPKITKGVFSVLSVANSVKSRKSYGGTAPVNVRSEANRWIKRLAKQGGRAKLKQRPKKA
jgi:argininosuccinate lyase